MLLLYFLICFPLMTLLRRRRSNKGRAGDASLFPLPFGSARDLIGVIWIQRDRGTRRDDHSKSRLCSQAPRDTGGKLGKKGRKGIIFYYTALHFHRPGLAALHNTGLINLHLFKVIILAFLSTRRFSSVGKNQRGKTLRAWDIPTR